MPTPTCCTCTRVRRAARALTDLYDDVLAPAGLKITQFSVLRTVQRLGRVSLSSLGAEMALDRSTLGRNLRVLEAMGLVTLAQGEDLRMQAPSLTRLGAERLRRALPLWERAQRKVRQRLGSDNVDELFATLERIEALRLLGGQAEGSVGQP